MKKIVISSLLTIGLLSSASAYELNGNLGVKWTGFKTEKKAPVSGTFKDIALNITKSDDLSAFLKSAKVQIASASFDSKNPFRDKNITSTLFSLATSKTIMGSISNVDTAKNMLTLDVTMNEVTKQVPMKYEMVNGSIVAKGTIEILDYGMKNSFMAFAKKCAGFHQNKSFSDVNIEFTLPYK
ncbi:YceI family protein [Poseidonibacter lekithochrous]|uniref:YceI family protein n=1 Tax=Poseidonibacter lekithochrous TaxID=1904463 RepID=UPI0008FCB58B|nr:YceI family protein [Poseidonibacter lekithochrous]QKJ22174.1 YceI-like domain-containing periplasmic protein [Poseidonibacter lekithochrous]